MNMTCNTHLPSSVCSTVRLQSNSCRAVHTTQVPLKSGSQALCCTSAFIGAPLRPFTSRRTASGCRSFHVNAAVATYSKDTPHLQLGTAKLGSGVDVPTFASKMYQWASTLTYQGRNMPFSLPFRTDPLETGFVMSLLRINNTGRPVSVGDITATVEAEPSVGNVLFVRFYEAEGSGMDRRTPPPTDEYKRLRAAADACVDIPTLMSSLPLAIKNAIKQSRTDV